MKNFYLLYPEFLLLLVPLLFIYFWRARARGLGGVVRLLILAILVFLAAMPLAPLGGKGVDVVVVADLSHSMPANSRERELEIVNLLENRRGAGDRVGIVTFGREARIERLPEEFGEAPAIVKEGASAFTQEVDADGSDLGGAISLAASLIPRSRPGRIIVMSDGESNGSPALAAAHEAAARGLPVDFRLFDRGKTADAAVESLDLPSVVDEREPFQFSAWVRTDRTIETDVVLSRDGTEIARKKQLFNPGATQLTFRDLIDRPGVARYRLELGTPIDRVPENNVGAGVLRVEAPATILLVNAGGGPDNLSRALGAGKLNVKTTTPRSLPHDLSGYAGFRAVILENVPAGDIGPQALGALTQFAVDLGGGVLVTGGKGSFGVGGYFKSVIDPYLPVSMEIKNEHRKLSLAMVVALDRSGSMAAPVGEGRAKMDLANLGTCAAIETLSPYDEVGVIAVDSSAHEVTPLVTAEDTATICQSVRMIRSMGGGIFVYTALATAAKMIQQSNKGTRHIVLFADAADSEEPGEYRQLLETITPLGITVSVIGLGTEADSDADFLKDVARRGQGRIYFTNNVEDLPRLFAEEAITVARSSFIDEPTPAHALSDMVLLGDLPASKFPEVDGYNLSYLRPGATMAVMTEDEYHAPLLSFWHKGLGRVAALTLEVDGKYSGSLNRWKDFGGFTTGLGRWLLGGDPPQGVRATMEREGGEGIVRLELDPDRKRGGADDIRSAAAAIAAPGDLAVSNKSGSGISQRLNLAWTGENSLEARFPIQKLGIFLGAVDLGQGRFLPLPPLTLPYSPEYEPRVDPTEGRKTLLEIARISGGTERTAWDGVFNASLLRRRQVRDLVIPLSLLLLLLHLTEIAGRRLFLFAAAEERLRSISLPKLQLPTRKGPAKPSEFSDSAIVPAEPKEQPEKPAPTPIPTTSPLERAKAKARNRIKPEL
jgi:Mg-chelatase subunit ChlD